MGLKVALVSIFIISQIVFWILYFWRRSSYNDGQKNIKMSWERIRSLYNIAPNKFKEGDYWCLCYKENNYNIFYLYPEFIDGTIKMHKFLRKIRKNKIEKKENEVKQEFINCMQKEINKYKAEEIEEEKRYFRGG